MPSSEERPKFLVSFSFSCSPKLVFFVPINQLVHYVLVGMKNVVLGGREPERETNKFGPSLLGRTEINRIMKCDRQGGITYKFIFMFENFD